MTAAADAVKLLAPTIASERGMRDRFLREARTAARCFHPNFVPVHLVEEVGDLAYVVLAYVVMAYVNGDTWADQEIGWALHCALKRGVVHRHVKPKNILIEDGTGQTLITDFGIALRAGIHDTVDSHGTAGTSQRRANFRSADAPRLRTTLARVTQHGAIPGPNTAAVRLAAPALPLHLADAIDRCLEYHATERFATAAAFVHAVDWVPAVPVRPPVLLPMASRASGARIGGSRRRR